MNDQYIKICYNKHIRENDICVFGLVSVRKLTRFRRFTLNDQNFKLSQKWNIIGPFVFFFQRFSSHCHLKCSQFLFTFWLTVYNLGSQNHLKWIVCHVGQSRKEKWTVYNERSTWAEYLSRRLDPMVMILALKRSEISRKKFWTWRTGNKLKSLLFIRNETQRKYSFSSVVD